MAAPTINQNQFKQQNLPGMLDLQSNPNPGTFIARFNASSSVTAGIQAGQPLKLVDLSTTDPNGVPIVDVATADTDYIVGVAVFNTKLGKVLPGGTVVVAGLGSIIWMQVKAAANRGIAVAADSSVPGQVLALTTGKYVFGQLLDKAALGSGNDICRVRVTCTGLKYSGVST